MSLLLVVFFGMFGRFLKKKRLQVYFILIKTLKTCFDDNDIQTNEKERRHLYCKNLNVTRTEGTMSSHVLDTASGSPACGVRISLELLGEDEEEWTLQDTRSGQVW